MTPTPPYRQILDFAIDEGRPQLSFEDRLAHENGWTREFARRVVVEYKRFVFLAATADRPVTPSDAVDQAWHLHLTYTRSYWERMCGEVLGRPLHHGPTRGGADESTKFHAQYQRTLAAYRAAFGEEPPADVWPPVAQRFGDDLHCVRVNVARNWVIPKAAIRRVVAAVVATVAAVVFGTGCAGAVANPYDLVGVEFLVFLIPMMLAAVVVGWICREHLRLPGEQPSDDHPDLDWADTAYLVGGRHQLTMAAIARSTAAGRVRVSDDGATLEPARFSADAPTTIEAEVVRALPMSRDRHGDFAELTRRVERAFADREARLREDGYLMTAQRSFAVGVAAVLPLLLVGLVLGLPRLAIGVRDGKPVGFLLATLIVATAVAVLLFVASLSRRTRRGKAVLKRLRATHERTLVGEPQPADAGMVVALFGAAALAQCDFAPLAALTTWYPRPTPGSGGDGGGCGSACGGGGCGGGGCGGGGCGGCGGG